MSDLKLSFVIEALDHVTRPLRQIRDGVHGAMRDIAQAANRGLNGIERFGNSAGGILASVGIGIELRDLVKNEDYFNRLRVQFGLTKDASEDLHKHILSAAKDTKAPVEELMAALRSSTELTGGVRNFTDNIGTAAAAIAILGGQGDAVGHVLGDLDKHFKITGPAELRQTLAMLQKQSAGMPGGFAGMVTGLDRVAELWAKIRGTGAQSVREFGALYSTLASGTGSSRRASTDLEDIVEAWGNLRGEDYRNLIRASQLPYGDASGHPIAYSVPEMLKAVSAQYTRNRDAVIRILGPALSRDIASIDFGMLARKLATSGDAAKFMHDAAEASKSLSGELNALHAALEQFETRELTGPLHFLTHILSRFPDWTAAIIGIVGALALFGLIVSPIRMAGSALMFLLRALGLVKAEAPLAAGAMRGVGEAAEITSRKLSASEAVLGRWGRGLQFRAGLGLLSFAFMAGDIAKGMDELDAATKKGPKAVEDLNRAKRQSFGERAFGWIPGLGGTDWNAEPHWQVWLRRHLGLGSAAGSYPNAADPASNHHHVMRRIGASNAELALAGRTLLGEAGNQGSRGMEAVADVLRNRLVAGNHGRTLRDVIMEPNQFSMWNGGDWGQYANDAALPRAISIMKRVLGGAGDITGGAENYYNPALASPTWGPLMSGQRKIGAHLFGTAPGEPGYGKQEITVKFENAPRGMRAAVTKADPIAADIALDMGWSMATQP